MRRRAAAFGFERKGWTRPISEPQKPDAKPPRFEDGLDAVKNRFSGILSDLHLEAPRELAQ